VWLEGVDFAARQIFQWRQLVASFFFGTRLFSDRASGLAGLPWPLSSSSTSFASFAFFASFEESLPAKAWQAGKVAPS